MPVFMQCEKFPLKESEVEWLWAQVKETIAADEAEVTIRCVDEKEILKLNRQYRQKDAATNVLTFCYPGLPGIREKKSHDIAVCLSVAEKEAREKAVALRDRAALLLAHALLHAAGMNHEASEEEAQKMREMEIAVLKAAGFTPTAW